MSSSAQLDRWPSSPTAARSSSATRPPASPAASAPSRTRRRACAYAMENIALVRNNALLSGDHRGVYDELVAPPTSSASDPRVRSPPATRCRTSLGAPVRRNTDGSYTNEIGGDAARSPPTRRLPHRRRCSTRRSTARPAAFLDGEAPVLITGPWTRRPSPTRVDISCCRSRGAGGQPAQPFIRVRPASSAKSKNAVLANEFVVNYLTTRPCRRRFKPVAVPPDRLRRQGRRQSSRASTNCRAIPSPEMGSVSSLSGTHRVGSAGRPLTRPPP